MDCEDKQINKLTADAVEELQTEFAGKFRPCGSGSEAKASICFTPADTDDIKRIIAYARRNGHAVVSSNNPLWTLDAEKAGYGGVYVSLEAFDAVGEVDPVAMSVRVGAAATWKDVVAKAAAAGFIVGSRPSDLERTVGSWAVTNGVGIGSYKYGSAKDNILNIRAVTAESLVIETGYDRIGSYMSGYNLTQLFSGSEGTLGIVTEVTVRLSPAGVTKPVAYTFPDTASLGKALREVVHHAGLEPYDISFCGENLTLLLALQGSQDRVDLEEEAADAIMEAAVKADAQQAANLWNLRSDYQRKGEQALVPLKVWKDFADAISGGFYGSVPDRSSAMFTLSSDSFDAIGMKAEELGGRKIADPEFTWTPYSQRCEEDLTLGRKVTPEIVSALKDIVGSSNVTTEGMDRILYSKDMAPLPKLSGLAFNNIPDVVVRPSNVDEVSRIMALAYKHGIPVVPRGNSSWGLGGCQPANAGIVLDMFSKFNKIIKLDTEGMAVKVGCGCTWETLMDACLEQGYLVGSYPSSFPSATIGAWISTNGMGVGSYKYGSAKDNILNMEVVLDDGTVLTTGDDDMGTYYSGYNLNQVFSGCEGTLGVFATVTLRIYPFGKLKPLAYEFDELSQANDVIQRIVAHPGVKPLHVAWADELHFINQRRAGIDAPDVKNLLLVTLQGDERFVELEERIVDAMVAEDGKGTKILDEAVALHEWSERCYEFRARKVGVGEIPAEVIVPASEWGTFVGECYKGFDVMKMEAGGVIGVLVDRNTVMFMPYYFKDDESLLGMTAFGFNFYLGDIATGYGGRTTGFGIFFAWNLDNLHNKDTVEYMRMMKSNLDPHDVVNPGHLVCGCTRFGVNMGKELMTIGSTMIQTVKKLMPRDTTFADNIKRFRYTHLEEVREADRHHVLGRGHE